MDHSMISVFTPSNTSPEILERIFVQRHRLLEKIVDRLKRSMLTGDKHHALLVGPRGSGKTHMLTLAHARLSQKHQQKNQLSHEQQAERDALREAMRIAWLGEDETITGLIDWALAIADRLAAAYPTEFEVDYRTFVRGLPPDDAGEAILLEINRRLQHRNLLLIVENLDAAFKGIGDQGQKRWRAFLQEKGKVATLATSQQLFDAVSDRDYPFWGFFDIHHLAPLSIEDAGKLIRNISQENGNQELVDFLDTTDGRLRIQSLHYLAGGNHRIYVLLSEFLTKESLDNLILAFEKLADELTPYFQERIRVLPAQQARIVQGLAAVSGAATVKEIAALTFIDERSCSKQLGELRNKRYVQSEKRGKESYYELSEPLMRLCLELKSQRSNPLRLIAQFIKVWFAADQLQKRLKSGPSIRTGEYLTAAMELENQLPMPVREKASKAPAERPNKRNYETAVDSLDNLQQFGRFTVTWTAAREKHESGDWEGALIAYTSLIASAETSVEYKVDALFSRGVIQLRLELMREALESFQHVVRLAPSQSRFRCSAMFLLPEPLIEVGLIDEVLETLRRAFEDNGPDAASYGGTPGDLFWMVLRRGSRDWSKYVAALLPLYVEFGVADKLAVGVTQLIARLDDGDFSHGQLDEWNLVWQQFGSKVEELQLALTNLSVAIEAIKTKSDRPLFQLPLEIRPLVRALLTHSLGPVS